MQGSKIFAKNTKIKIFYPELLVHDKEATIIEYNEKHKKYCVKFDDGKHLWISKEHIIKPLSKREELEFKKGVLLSMVDLALETYDQEWFYEITNAIKEIDDLLKNMLEKEMSK